MTAPLFAVQLDPDARTAAFGNGAAEGHDEGLDVCERNGCRRRSSEDSNERLAVLSGHDFMIANNAITRNRVWKRRRRPCLQML